MLESENKDFISISRAQILRR